MSNKKSKTAINPTREKDFPQWYQEVVKEAEMAEMDHVRGCMVIKPWGYGIWENIQKVLGEMIKENGVENVYFPLFIPLKYIQKEADHVEGFAKEMAVVTHHRLQKNEETGELEPAGKLTEPVVVRPTSETIIGESMSQWVKSYRDLPLKLNQWCNVVRWEMRPRVFLRTVEFLWQEGHTAFATSEEAIKDAKTMIEVYRDFVENWLAIPLIVGTKPAYDKFPGAVDTYCIEALMQDGKALQAGTSHYLGENFAKSANIQYSANDGLLKHAHTASWGVSTRLIGGMIMTHADDDGMRVPPKIAPSQVVIIPYLKDGNVEENKKVLDYASEIVDKIKSGEKYGNEKIRVKLDDRQIGATDKKWSWIKKGAPIQVEVGMRDLESGVITYRVRSEASNEKHTVSKDEFIKNVVSLLDGVQNKYFEEAKERLNCGIVELNSFKELKEYFEGEQNPSFVKAPYFEDAKEDPRLKELAVTIRCFPDEQTGEEKDCILSGRKTDKVAIFARSY